MMNGLTRDATLQRARRAGALVLASVAAFLCFPGVAIATKKKVATPKPTFVAARLIQSEAALSLPAGTSKTFRIGFKNNGTAVWTNAGPGYLSVYTTSPEYRRSRFQDVSWKSFRQAAVLKNGDVHPGELGFFEIVFRAPESPGNFMENFALAAEDSAWVKGSEFSIPITVTAPPALPAAPPEALARTNVIPPPNLTDIQALRLTQSAPALTLRPGEEQEFRILFKNVGLKPWLDQAVRVRDNEPVTASTQTPGTLAFQHESWSGPGLPVFVHSEILPGEVSMNRFSIRAPAAPGAYLAQFQFVANGIPALGGDFDIPITVTDDAGRSPVSAIPLGTAIPEPSIRVGLYTADGPVAVTATEPLAVRTVEGLLLGIVDPGATVTLAYIPGGGYTAMMPSGSATVSSPIRLVPTSPAVLTIANYQNHPRWSTKMNDNAFRGILELRRIASGFTWVINELPFEDYLRGLAETGNGSPSEYHKAIVVAARTYAYWHELNPDKHEDFTIDAYWDQVYRGYNSEQRMQNFVASVEETRGVLITYQNELVVTPYFARSDGRTRSWQEVWHGAPKPWLVPVSVPSDAGYRLLGHGVGMSATAAAEMAKSGKAYPEILKFFYTGTDLTKLW